MDLVITGHGDRDEDDTEDSSDCEIDGADHDELKQWVQTGSFLANDRVHGISEERTKGNTTGKGLEGLLLFDLGILILCSVHLLILCHYLMFSSLNVWNGKREGR